jgi:hypothetical protein
MTIVRPTDADLDTFLREVDAEFDRESAVDATAPQTTTQAAHALSVLSETLPQLSPSVELRARLLQSARSEGRLARFAGSVADMLDVSLGKAKQLLERIDDPAAWSLELPGVSFLWVEGGPAVAAAVRGFVRVSAGQEFPHHEHLGEELVLVLQGGFQDPSRGRVFRPGDTDRMPAGSSHAFRALPGGPDLVKLAVVHTGLRALGQDYLPRG